MFLIKKLSVSYFTSCYTETKIDALRSVGHYFHFQKLDYLTNNRWSDIIYLTKIKLEA